MMSPYAALIGTIAGICLGYALLYVFVGLRRSRDRRISLYFAAFAFGYAGTLLMGIWYRSQTTVEAYLAVSRWDGLFIWLAFVSLNWYVAAYTRVRARLYLWAFSIAFTFTTVATMATPTLAYAQQPTLTAIPLPWNEIVFTLDGEENIWGLSFLILLLVTLGFILIAGIQQWRRGERQDAGALLGGMSWFIVALAYEIGAEAGLWIYIPFAEAGFLGIAVALSLQMANSVIKTEEDLAHHQNHLETLVEERTTEVEEVNRRLLQQERTAATNEERRRLASELHDSVTQTLYSVSLVAAALPRLLDRNIEEAKRSAGHLRNMTLGALAEMRTLLYELRPEAFETARLAMLLQQASDVFTGRTNVPVDVVVETHRKLSTETKRALYRIAQEALNNAAKHADASTVEVLLREIDDQFLLQISDDGRGFDVETVRNGLGIDIMQERARQANATLEIIGVPGEGTTVQVQLATEFADE